MKVLSVDDAKSVHSFLKMCLSGTDVDLAHAYSGEEALAILIGDSKTEFDLILLDWEMPGLTGPDVLVKLKEANLTTPVIMLTSRNKPEDIMKILELGAVEYIMKPFTQDLIQEKINSVMGA